METAPRINALLTRLQWPQSRMADFLRVRQSSIARLAAGQEESGPVSVLLDQLTAALVDGRVVPGASVADVRAAIGCSAVPARRLDVVGPSDGSVCGSAP